MAAADAIGEPVAAAEQGRTAAFCRGSIRDKRRRGDGKAESRLISRRPILLHTGGVTGSIRSRPPRKSPPGYQPLDADAGDASGTMTELVIAISAFLIGFCATDFVWRRIETGRWL
jgi:hypothetical protein